MRSLYFTMLSSSCGLHFYDIGDDQIIILETDLDCGTSAIQDFRDDVNVTLNEDKGFLSVLRSFISFIHF